MSSILLVIISAGIFISAYFIYGKYIERKLFRADPKREMPSYELRDDIDYMPTNKEVLFGHHFASIAGTGPIVGPAIAVIWGWLPAVVWIIVGSVFVGAVHDYAALIISSRFKGVSIGELSRDVVNKRVRVLFLFVIFFSLWIVVAIFGMVIAIIFSMYPQSVFPVWMQVPVAVTVGWLAYKKGMSIGMLSVAAVLIMYVSIFIGAHMPIVMPGILGFKPMSIWIVILFIYAFLASVMPVWSLLQPRDYINSHQLILGVFLLLAGIFISRPVIVAPAFRTAPIGAPPILPFLFVTVACGAISGFHSLVGSGTSSKQLKSENDVRFIGYGGMLMEGFLAILVVIAVAAGIGLYEKNHAGTVISGIDAWRYHYSSWAAMKGLTAKVTAFVNGAANMLKAIGIPLKYGQAIIGVMIASFAGTTLDTATRIQRYVVSEIAAERKITFLQKRYPATLFAVLAAVLLAFSQEGGTGALRLWPLFGTSNQLLAGLALLVTAVYLKRRKVNIVPVVIPMIFMMITSSWALCYNIYGFTRDHSWHLVILGGLILVLEIWMVMETVKAGLEIRKTAGKLNNTP